MASMPRSLTPTLADVWSMQDTAPAHRLMIASHFWDTDLALVEGCDYFASVKPFVEEGEDELIELFAEYAEKSPDDLLGEVGELQSIGALDTRILRKLKADSDEERRRQLFVRILCIAAEEEEADEGEEDGEEDGRAVINEEFIAALTAADVVESEGAGENDDGSVVDLGAW